MATVDIGQVAHIIREVAAEEVMPRWGNLAKGDVQRKSSSGDLVTIADHAAEVALTRRLEELLPGSKVVGEEAVAANPDVLRLFLGDGAVWVIDPIDGTRKYSLGEPTFDVMVGLVVDGIPVAGWIYAPAEDTFCLGESGGGAQRLHGETAAPIHAPSGPALASMEGILAAGAFTQRGRPDPADVGHRFRGFVKPQCAGHNYARLFAGQSHFLINFSTHPWDHLPGLAIAHAAGFVGARHDGRPFDPMDAKGGMLVAPDRASWSSVHELLLRAN